MSKSYGTTCSLDLLASDDDDTRTAHDEDASPDKEPRPELVLSTSTSSLMLQGAATGTTITRKTSKTKHSKSTTSTTARKAVRSECSNQRVCGNDVNVPASSGAPEALEVEQVRDQLEFCRRELAHVREEKSEIESAFRRLDKEIGNGYNLVERKEKEMKIAELMAKNQKMAQMLEKEVQTQNTLRVVNSELQEQVHRQQEQLTLVNQVLSSLEAKHTALIDTNRQLSSNHASAQDRISTLQEQVHTLQAQLLDENSHEVSAYEAKVQSWESRYLQLQQRFDEKTQLLNAEQDRTKALQEEVEWHRRQEERLKQELMQVHDHTIKMSGTIKTMEAKLEATLPAAQAASTLERMKQRVRVLEEEVLSKNRQLADLMQTTNELLAGDRPTGKTGRSRRPNEQQAISVTRVRAMTSRMATLTERLRATEDALDHKIQCLDLLLRMIPHLLQQLDALQDKYHAASESNSILTSAVEQLQQQPEACDTLLPGPGGALSLAREEYIISASYQPDLLMGYTVWKAFSDSLAPRTPTKRGIKNFMPFQAASVIRTTYNGEEERIALIVADKDDANGVTFLNRAKINAFLQFAQGEKASKKFKALVLTKLAEILTKQRELMHQYSSESAYYKISLATIEQEVEHLKKKLKRQFEAYQERMESHTTTTDCSTTRSHLINKIVDLLIENQTHQQSTFLTQPIASTSDILISSKAIIAHQGVFGDDPELDLSRCDLNDQDIESLLLKIQVSGVRLRGLYIEGNNITDDGAATIAEFLEACPAFLRDVNLDNNRQITAHGIKRIKDGLGRNSRVQRVVTSSRNNIIQGLAVQQEFDLIGAPSVVLQVKLPDVDDDLGAQQDEHVTAMVQQLRDRGLSEAAISTQSFARAQVVYKGTQARKPVAASRMSATAKKEQLRRDKEVKFRAVEAAIRRAQSSTPKARVSESSKSSINLARIQYLTKSRARAIDNSSTATSSRQRKLQFAQSHLATIRGLQR
ncbi:hypothetical protein Poli38472_003242 [Pythium oligandrum]|uniref:Uncharacterized protein n=1 Tax=Pythium oligandrum TaxID=41045 RepID=A0A8K1FF52_PYTOL|nr:hypothetical protein Poli38472_003242 [Pythium oligandrum]|eukprot:TMW57317.1 hypothetical protein Poli38472_003242 [Pythium oligandrum]